MGEIEKDGGTLVIRRIHVHYHLKVPPGMESTAERVHAMHADHCPVYRSISGCIDITTELELTSV